MTEIDLSFRIDINSSMSFQEFCDWLHVDWADLDESWKNIPKAVLTEANWITVSRNHYRKSQAEISSFYYPYYIQADSRKYPPTPNDITYQISLLDQFVQRLRSKGCKLEVIALFNYK